MYDLELEQADKICNRLKARTERFGSEPKFIPLEPKCQSIGSEPKCQSIGSDSEPKCRLIGLEPNCRSIGSDTN